MRNWDMTAGAAKLDLAYKALQTSCGEIATSWDDDTNRRFTETYVTPLEPRLKTLLDSLHRLAEILSTAESHCRDEH